MRPWLIGMLALLPCLAGCERSNSEPGVPAPSQPPGPNGCQDACRPPPLSSGPATDPVEFLATGVDQFGGFFEPVEVQTWRDKVVMCTGVRGLTIYRADEPCCLSHEVSVIPDLTRNYPRCQHFSFVGDTVYLTNHGDEILPDTFVSAVDLSDLSTPRQIETYLSPNDASFEGIATRPGVAYVAQHEAGVAVFRLEGDGKPTYIRNVDQDLTNAWQPRLDPAGAFLYVADASGSLVVFDVSEPLNPRHLTTVRAQGTLKDLAWHQDRIYAASGSTGVEVFDVQDPGRATLVGRADTEGSALGVSAEGHHLVVADWNDVHLFDISQPDEPVRLGHQQAYATRRGEVGPDPLGRVLDATIKDGLIYMAEWAGPQVHRVVDGADAPDIFVSSTVELPRTEPGAQQAVGIPVWNLGRRPLTIADVIVDAPFQASISGTEVAPGLRQVIEVTFSPQGPEQAQAVLRILSDDPDLGEAQVQLRANLPGLRAGDEVPDFGFTALDGTSHRLSEARGQPVLLAYFATF